MAQHSAMAHEDTQHLPRLNILLKAARGHQVIDVRRVLLIEADERYCRAVLTDGSYRQLFHTLSEMERILRAGERLGDLLFLRTHRSYIVAFHHVIATDGPYNWKLQGNITVPVSRQLRADMLTVAGSVRPAR